MKSKEFKPGDRVKIIKPNRISGIKATVKESYGAVVLVDFGRKIFDRQFYAAYPEELVKLKKKPKPRRFWINIYDVGQSAFTNEQDALAYNCEERIEVVEVLK